MKVESIDSRMPFKFMRPRSEGKLPEGLTFLAGAALVLFGPTLIYCLVIGEALPFYWMAATQSLGVLLGLWMYTHKPAALPPCVPATRVPHDPPARAMLKAA